MKKQLVVATLIMAICAPSWAATSGEKNQEIIDNQGRKAKVEVKKNKDGKHEAVVTPEGCSDGVSCQQVVLLKDDQINNFKEIEIAIRKDAEEKRLKEEADAKVKAKAKVSDKISSDDQKTARKEEKRSERRERLDESSLKDYKEEVRDELADLLSTECDVEADSSKLSREEKRSRLRSERTDDVTSVRSLGGTRWADLELPRSSEKARCASKVVQSFMDEQESEFNEHVDSDSLKELKSDITDLKRDLRKTKDEGEKKHIQEEIDKKQAEYTALKKDVDSFKAKKKIADDETTRVFKSQILKPAILDAANSGDAHGSLLYKLAVDSPEMFSGVRKASSEALLSVYKLQAQSQLALKEAAAKTNDPSLKLQYSQEAMNFNTQGLNFNRNMMDIGLRERTRNKAKDDYLMSNAQNPAAPTVDEVMAAQSYANGVLKDIYGAYDTGASQITTYLNTISASPSAAGRTGTTQGLPQILSDNRIADMISVGGSSSTGTFMRGGSARIGMTRNGAAPSDRPARLGSAPRQ